jgi:hypothetical protein
MPAPILKFRLMRYLLRAELKSWPRFGFDPVSKDVHQADNYPGHSGPQRVAEEEALLESAFDIDGFENALHHLPAIVDTMFSVLNFLSFSRPTFSLVCIMRHLKPNVSLPRDPWELVSLADDEVQESVKFSSARSGRFVKPSSCRQVGARVLRRLRWAGMDPLQSG